MLTRAPHVSRLPPRSSKVKYPKFLSSDALSLLKALLTREPAKRLGAGTQGAEAVRRHPFFK